MALDLADYEKKTQKAVRLFWEQRDAAKKKQIESGTADHGERASVTAGRNMEGFIDLIKSLVIANGLENASIYLNRRALALPGYFRPTKLWDMLVMHKGELVLAIELKSQVGPSFGNNFNNRAEEAIGTAHDFWTAYREGAFGKQPRPYVGWLMLVEDITASRAVVREHSPHFRTLKEFTNTSYLQRYDLLCQKLVKEGLYGGGAIICASRKDAKSGGYGAISQMTSLKTFVASISGHIAAQAVRLG